MAKEDPKSEIAAIRYTVSADAYPRFKYVRTRLSSITPRLQKLTGAEKFENCISQGKEKLFNITKCTQFLQGDVKVTVVGDDVKIPPNFASEQLLGLACKDAGGEITLTQEPVSKTAVMEDMKSSSKFHPDIIVCWMMALSPKNLEDVFAKFSALENDQQQNLIVYDAKHGINYSFHELVEAKYICKNVKEGNANKKLCHQIQYQLTDRTAELLENVVDFCTSLAPRDGEDVPLPIYLECNQQVQACFKDPYILDDLDPNNNREPVADGDAMDTGEGTSAPPQLTEDQENEVFFQNVVEFMSKKTKLVLCDHLSKKYGISTSLINELLNEGYANYENRYRTAVAQVSPRPQWARVKRCTEASVISRAFVTKQMAILQAAEDYICRMLRRLANFAKLRFEVYGVLRKVKEHVVMPVPTYPALPKEMANELNRIAGVVGCGTIYGQLTVHIDGDSDDNISSKHNLRDNIKTVLAAHNYSHSYRLQRLVSRRLQAGVVRKFEAGDQLKARLTPKAENAMLIEENEWLKKEKAKLNHQRIDLADRMEIEKDEETLKQENVMLRAENQTLRNEIQLPEGDDRTDKMADRSVSSDKLGTLGCFIGLREKSQPSAGTGACGGATGGEGTSGSNRAQLYAITAAHCVTDCCPNIQAKQQHPNSVFQDFGEKTHLELYEQERIDIAAMQVTVSQICCNSDISLAYWEFYTGEAGDLHSVADVVYKHGAASQTTEGIIVSNDYHQTEVGDNPRDDLMARANVERQCNFTGDFNILVDVLVASGAEGQSFVSSSGEVGTNHSRQAMDIALEEKDPGQHKMAPIFSTPLPDSARAEVGESVTLECVVGGSPKPQVVWYHGDKTVQGNSSSVGTRHQLVIVGVVPQDGGVYRAVATNSEGNASTSCQLQVIKPTFSKAGDSGSVIYYRNIDDNRVYLASLLTGNIVIRDGFHGDLDFTYSIHLKKCLDCLCEVYNKEIVKPWDIHGNR